MDIHPLIRQRSSPRAFSAAPVEAEKLKLIFEAARWAPSSFNEQPWRFLVATREDGEWRDRLEDYLSEGNAWAKQAAVLIASAYSTRFARDDEPNRVAMRDLGAAEENMFLQACAVGLAMHQLAGFDSERIKRELLPEGFEPGVMAAIGYPRGAGGAGEENAESGGRKPRSRKPLDQFVFGAAWGEAAAFL